jgi:hypothetical protein
VAINIYFKPGAKQARLAADYYQEVIRSFVAEHVDHLRPEHFLVVQEGQKDTALRIWSPFGIEGSAVADHTQLLQSTSDCFRRLRRGHGSITEVTDVWQQLREDLLKDGRQVVLLERLVLRTERVTQVAGVRGDDLVFVNGPGYVFTQLDDGLFGLALEGRGSYLIERPDDDLGQEVSFMRQGNAEA